MAASILAPDDELYINRCCGDFILIADGYFYQNNWCRIDLDLHG